MDYNSQIADLFSNIIKLPGTADYVGWGFDLYRRDLVVSMPSRRHWLCTEPLLAFRECNVKDVVQFKKTTRKHVL